MRIVEIATGRPLPLPVRSVVALGFFDGVHIGHLALLRAACREAERLDAEPAVFTFSDDIGKIKVGAARLTGFDEKIRLFSEVGIRTVYVAEFSAVSSMSPAEFVSDILIRVCGAALAVCGFNFRFGRGASGDAETLCRMMRERGGETAVIAPASVGGQTVSASVIRAALADGDMDRVTAMLGRYYAISATVEHGRGFGHTEGIPTVNQRFREHAAIPRCGVYASTAYIEDGEAIRAVSNVGRRPTFGEEEEIRCETYLIGYSGDLYGKRLRVELRSFLRPERKFDSVEALYRQIRQDIADSQGK